MRYIKQKKNQCALAAVCQIREDLDYEKLSKSYNPESWADQFKVTALLGRTALIKDVKISKTSWAHSPTIRNPDLSGKGVLVIESLVAPARHCISYENGKVLDPADKNGVSMTYADYMNLHTVAKVIAVLPLTDKKGE